MSMKQSFSRRKFLSLTTTGLAGTFFTGCSNDFDWDDFFQKQFQEMSPAEVSRLLQRLEKKYKDKYDTAFTVKATPARENSIFAFGIDLSKCIGCRRCVSACTKENNISRDIQIQYIRVVRMAEGEIDFIRGDHYYNPKEVPEEGYYYMPVQCQQCENPPCVKVCPVNAMWQEPDGIVAIDYNWCIGCRDCMAACPYQAIKFNWTEPKIPKEEINPKTHYLGNRPRMKGVVEKCHVCVHRTREGRYPACNEACPTGARKFGNLLDADSEIRHTMANFKTYKLKTELNTRPRFFYFFSSGEKME